MPAKFFTSSPQFVVAMWTENNIGDIQDVADFLSVHGAGVVVADNGDGTASFGTTTLNNGDFAVALPSVPGYIISSSSDVRVTYIATTFTSTSGNGIYLKSLVDTLGNHKEV